MVALRFIAAPFVVLCILWVCGVPSYYVATLDQAGVEDIRYVFVHASRHVIPERLALSVFLLTQFVIVPAGLVLGVWLVWQRLHSRASRGIVAGLTYAMWANTVLLSVPYLGGYSSLPVVCVVLILVGNKDVGSPFFLSTLGMNTLLWPVLGAHLVLRNTRPSSPDMCRKCGYNLTGNVSRTCPECGNPTQ